MSERPVGSAPTRPAVRVPELRRWFEPPAVVALNVAVVSVLAALPFFFEPQAYALRLFCQIFLSATVVLGFFVILGLSKQFSLGQVAIYGIGAYAMAILTVRMGWPFLPALLASGALGALVGALVAVPGARFQGPWLALVTFAFAEIIRLLMLRAKDITGGSGGFRDIGRPEILGWQLRTEFDYYWLFFGLALCTYLFALRLRHSPLGRIWLAIGDNPDIAASAGVNVFAHRVLAFACGSFVAAVAGASFAGYATFISPESFGIGHTIHYLTLLVVGGLESIAGVLLAAAFFTLLHNQLMAYHPWELVIDGLIILIFMNLLPHGIGSLIGRLQANARRRDRERK